MPIASGSAAAPRALTVRSVFLGLLGLFIVSAGAGYHHAVLGRSGVWMISNHMPPVVFAYMLAVGLGWNGLVGRFRRQWALSAPELVVVMSMSLVACFPANAGLMRYALRNLVLPWHFLPGFPDWTAHGLLETYLPSYLFPSPVPVRQGNVLLLDKTVYQGFVSGLSQGKEWVGLSGIPWSAWLPAMAYWGPLVGTLSLAVIAMSFLVHKQWSEHEQLSYPVAQVASSFWRRADGGRGVPDIYRNRLFWAGFVPLFLLCMVDVASDWFPQALPGLDEMLPNLKSWSLPVTRKMPVLRKVPGSWQLGWQQINFAIVGLAYFVSTEISLTMGLSQILLVVFGTVFLGVVGTPLGDGDLRVMRAGAYLGYTMILLYTGRTYFRAVFRKAFLGRGGEPGDSPAVMAARVLVLAFGGFVAVLMQMGCDAPMAVLYGLSLMMLFLVLTRIICETGIPFLQAGWNPGTLLVSLLGPAAVGPRAMALLTWTNSIIAEDPRECLMPYVATSLRMADETKLRLRRFFWWIAGTVALAVVVAFVAQLWVLYNHGAIHDGWAGTAVPKHPFNAMSRWFSTLRSSGEFELSEAAGGLDRLRLVAPEGSDLRFFAAGILCVLAFALSRLRWTRFPIHPVLFLAWGTWPAGISWSAYLLGWFIKTLVVRLGGGRAYLRLKPVFIGIIAGELMAISFVVLLDLVYYWTTGEFSGVVTSIQRN